MPYTVDQAIYSHVIHCLLTVAHCLKGMQKYHIRIKVPRSLHYDLVT